jgi:hypothetical protein
MPCETFDVIKDNLVKPVLKDNESLVILPEPLRSLEFTTKAPVWMHLVTWIPFCTYVWVDVIQHHTHETVGMFAFAFAVLWPLTEYLLHRFAFHFPVAWAGCLPQWAGGSVNVVRLLVHTVHHAHPQDRLRLVTPLTLSVPIALLVLSPVFWIAPTRDLAWAWCTGLLMGYVLYDMAHYYMHFGRPSELPDWLGPIKRHVRELHKAHANHHYSNGGHRESFGVAHTLWDHVFGTNRVIV